MCFLIVLLIFYAKRNKISKRYKYIQEAADASRGAMVSIIGLDSDKVQQLCDAANEEVEEAEKVQIANYLCTVMHIYYFAPISYKV